MKHGIGRVISIVASELGGFGYARLGKSSVLAGRYGRVVHAMAVRKSRTDNSFGVSVAAWVPELAIEPDRPLQEQLILSHFGGDISPEGLRGSYWWDIDGLDENLLKRCLRNIGLSSLAAFASRNDLIQAIPEMPTHADTKTRLEYALQRVDGDLPLPPALDSRMLSYPNELARHRQYKKFEYRKIIDLDLKSWLMNRKFQLKENSRQAVFVREEGPLSWIIEPKPSYFGVHTALHCYVWSPKIWKVRSEFKGLYIETNGGPLGEEKIGDGICCFPTGMLEEKIIGSSIEDKIESQAMPFFNSIPDEDSFLGAINDGWREMLSAPLSRIFQRS